MRRRRSRELTDLELVELEMGNIIGVHVGDKLKSVHCTRGTGIVKLASGTPFEPDDRRQIVTGKGWPAGTTVRGVVSGTVAVFSKAQTMSPAGSPN